jgi:hypothetical protein
MLPAHDAYRTFPAPPPRPYSRESEKARGCFEKVVCRPRSRSKFTARTQRLPSSRRADVPTALRNSASPSSTGWARQACDFSFTHAVGLRFHALLIAGAQEVRFETVPKR